MDFRILGPLEVLDDGREVALAGSKPRALLALLLLHANETLTSDRLIDELWGERPPAAAAKSLQMHDLSSAQGAGGRGRQRRRRPIVTREHGYRADLDPEQLDSYRFERLVAEGRSELAAGRASRRDGARGGALAMARAAACGPGLRALRPDGDRPPRRPAGRRPGAADRGQARARSPCRGGGASWRR